MSKALAELLELMEVEQLEENLFRGQCQDLGFRKLFSGLMLAQALSALMLGLKRQGLGDWMPHSIHGYFLSPGTIQGTVDLEITDVRTGRSFSNRLVNITQNGETIASVTCSFQMPEEGFSHQISPPATMGPDGLASQAQLSPQWRDSFPERQRPAFGDDYPFEMRVLNPVNMLAPVPCEPNKQVWLRPAGETPKETRLKACVLVYASAFNMLTTALQPHGVSVWHEDMQCVTLEHNLWFHAMPKLDDWMFYDIVSPGAGGGRGLIRGELFTRTGELIASVAQESLIRRWPGKDSIRS